MIYFSYMWSGFYKTSLVQIAYPSGLHVLAARKESLIINFINLSMQSECIYNKYMILCKLLKTI